MTFCQHTLATWQKKKEQYKGTDKTVLITQVVSLTLLSEGMCRGMR